MEMETGMLHLSAKHVAWVSINKSLYLDDDDDMAVITNQDCFITLQQDTELKTYFGGMTKILNQIEYLMLGNNVQLDNPQVKEIKQLCEQLRMRGVEWISLFDELLNKRRQWIAEEKSQYHELNLENKQEKGLNKQEKELNKQEHEKKKQETEKENEMNKEEEKMKPKIKNEIDSSKQQYNFMNQCPQCEKFVILDEYNDVLDICDNCFETTNK